MSYVAVDIGATRIRVASGDEGGLRTKLSELTDRDHGPSGVPHQIVRMIRSLGVSPVSIGIGSIGPLNAKAGVIGATPNLPFSNFPVSTPLVNEFGVPVELMNDCNAAVIGENHFGAGKGIDNLFYVTLSTGLGGGAIVDGHVLGGKDGNAPEIGHLVIDPDSKLWCGCGRRGHWEAYCSGANIPNFARLILEGKSLSGTKLGELAGDDPARLTSEAIFRAAAAGDPNAVRVVSDVGRVNAVGFADIVNAFDPELITVGGSIALNNPGAVLAPIKKGTGEYLINRMPEVSITPLGDDVVLYGALAVAMRIANR